MMTNSWRLIRGSEYPCAYVVGDEVIVITEAMDHARFRLWCMRMLGNQLETAWSGQVTLSDQTWDGPFGMGGTDYSCTGEVVNGILNFRLIREGSPPW